MQRLTQKRFPKRIKIVCNDEDSVCDLQDSRELLVLVGLLKNDPDALFDQFLDLICEDLESMRLSYLFHSTKYQTFLKVRFNVESDEHVPSLCDSYQSANWLEREVFDLFGVRFDGHPYLKRLLLYPEFAGHPLRKSYPADKSQPMVPIYA